MDNSVKERIKEFLAYKNLSQRTFEKEVGLSNGYVNNIRKSIQPDKLQKIALRYPGLNTGWLMTGEGQMLKKDSKEIFEVYTGKDINKAFEYLELNSKMQEVNERAFKYLDRYEAALKRIKELEKENEALKSELQELRAAHN